MFALHLVTTPHALPLRWLRVPLLLGTTGLSAVAIAVGIQAIRGIHRMEGQTFTIGGVEYSYSLTDIKSLSYLLTIFGFLLGLSSVSSFVVLAYDWIQRLIHPKVYEKKSETITAPLSTRTLGLQTLIFGSLTLCLFSILIPMTFFVRTRWPMVNLTPAGSKFDYSTIVPYWGYGFLRCEAAAPWFSIIFSTPTTLVTLCAWRMAKAEQRQPSKDWDVIENKGHSVTL